MDGLICALLLKDKGLIDDVTFAHPKDMQDSLVDAGADDITTNLPYDECVHLAFDHHASDLTRLEETPDNYIVDPNAPSAARIARTRG